MDHLRAELEIRGLWKCAKKLPKLDKKCYEKVEEVVRRCEEGDCFVDPAKVAEEFSRAFLEDVSAATLALAALAIIEGIAIIFLFWELNVVRGRLAELGALKAALLNLKYKVNYLENSFTKALSDVKTNVEQLKETLEALKYVVYLLGK